MPVRIDRPALVLVSVLALCGLLFAVTAASPALATASPASATAEPRSFPTQHIELLPTAAGNAVLAAGAAALRPVGAFRALDLRAAGDLPEGTVLVVSVDDGVELYDIGTLTIELGSGLLQLTSDEATHSAAFREGLRGLQRFEVRLRNEVLLRSAPIAPGTEAPR